MPLDPVARAAVASFTAGCAGIHALRRHADVVTLVLSALAYGLTTAISWMLVGCSGLLGLSDPVHASALVATPGI